MPAISVDTFFACSLMVLIVLSAMAISSKLLYPHIYHAIDLNIDKRYQAISEYVIVNEGKPSSWGQNNQEIPEIFGLAKADSNIPYELDIDKVSRLNNENLYAVTYAQIFTALDIPDVSIGIEVQPIFEVTINLTSTSQRLNETSYEFEILTEKHGAPVQSELKSYVIAANYMKPNPVSASDGVAYINITLPNDTHGPAILVILGRSAINHRITSFNTHPFAHNSTSPKPKGTFLNLSPCNYTLNTSLIHPDTNLSDAYALSFNYSSTLTQTANENQSVTYNIPHFLDLSPTLLIITGLNATSFFSEWTAYPQIPIQTGANFGSSTSLSNVLVYTYLVTIESIIYECKIQLGGPRE